MLVTVLLIDNKTCIEMIKNADVYENHPKISGCCHRFSRKVVWTVRRIEDCLGFGQLWFYQTSSARMLIRFILLNGVQDCTYLSMILIIEPIMTSNESINIMWTGQSKYKHGIWTQNQFVPVMKGNEKVAECHSIANGNIYLEMSSKKQSVLTAKTSIQQRKLQIARRPPKKTMHCQRRTLANIW